jgi:hypothetical protein
LDGSNSYVSDGSKIKYHWTFSPGLVLDNDNDFSSEISVESYGEKYLRSVETYKNVLDVKLAGNVPGTKLEVILTIKDRIGFEDMDTMIVEYYDPTIILADTLVDTLDLELDSLQFVFSDSDSVMLEAKSISILIYSIIDDQINEVDEKIINSIIKDQLQKIGYRSKVNIKQDLENEIIDQGSKLHCKSDSCISSNAEYFDTKYILSWNFAESEDIFLIRIYKIENFENPIAKNYISKPYKIISETSIYGFEPELRAIVSQLMGARDFKKEIPIFNRLKIKMIAG